jgi:mRNA-degrading endonuclease RelE of RelBE toxin-antitoxin system
MTIEFLPEAEDELGKATNYYNEIRVGLGFEFADEVKNTLKRIAQYPEAWPVISKRSRRCRTNRFPYGVIYQIRDEMILIVAVMHLHREPEYWKSRIS